MTVNYHSICTVHQSVHNSNRGVLAYQNSSMGFVNQFVKIEYIFKLKILYYMKVKYITTTNKHFFDVSLPLDDEMKLKAWHYQH